MPNFASFFEGHYLVVMPPLLHSAILPWWVKTFFRRDPGFARTLRTEINPVWLRRTIHALDGGARLRIVSLGEEVFSERLNAPAFGFQHAAVGSVLAPVINFLRKLNVGNIAANLLITLKAHYPIYLTVKKEAV
jgi:hypothetical protein